MLGTRTPIDLTPDDVEAPVRAIDSLAQAWTWVSGIGQPLLVGMVIMAVTGSIIAYWGTQLAWRLRVAARRRRQRRERSARASARAIGSA